MKRLAVGKSIGKAGRSLASEEEKEDEEEEEDDATKFS